MYHSVRRACGAENSEEEESRVRERAEARFKKQKYPWKVKYFKTIDESPPTEFSFGMEKP